MKNNQRSRIRGTEPPNRLLAPAIPTFGLIAGVLVIYFHGLNRVFNAYYHSNRLLYDKITPEVFELLNRCCGAGIIFLSLAYLLYRTRFKEKTDKFLQGNYERTILVLLGIISLLIIYSALFKYFHNDEIEHIHSAWYVKNSFFPYRDFFQHHNPLLWYLLLPILHLFGDTLATLTAARIFMVAMMLGIAFLTYLIASTASRSRETGLVSVALLFSSVTFPEKGIEIRPDVPEILFGLLSIYLMLLFFQRRRDGYLVYSGLSAAVSILFLQKTVFLLLSYLAIFSYGGLKKAVRPGSAVRFVAAFSLPILLFIAWLQFNGALHDYYLTNVALNLHHFGSSELSFRLLGPLQNSLGRKFWLLLPGAAAAILLFRDKKSPPELKMLIFAGLVELFSLNLFSKTFKHFFLFAIVIFCIIGSYYLVRLLDSLKTARGDRIALIALLLSSAFPFLVINSLHSHRLQFEKMQYVLDVTKDTDLVHDGINTFNLYRRDLHYFWYQLGVGLSTYNRASNNRYGDYDACKLVMSKRPKIISGIEIDFGGCGLWTRYDPTGFKRTYIRREDADWPSVEGSCSHGDEAGARNGR